MIKSTLNELLEQQNKTKYWLAKETGISQNAIGNFANNKTKMVQYELLNKICMALNCKLEDILIYEEKVEK